MLQGVTGFYRVLQFFIFIFFNYYKVVTGCHRVLQGVAGCYRVLQGVTV